MSVKKSDTFEKRPRAANWRIVGLDDLDGDQSQQGSALATAKRRLRRLEAFKVRHLDAVTSHNKQYVK